MKSASSAKPSAKLWPSAAFHAASRWYTISCSAFSSLVIPQVLDDHRNALPAADARSREPIFPLAAAQLVHQRNNQPRSGRAQRMPERNRAAIHVDFVAIKPQFFFNRKILRGEGLVHLDQINVVECQSSFLQRDASRRNRPRAHDLRVDTGDSPAHDAGHGLQTALSSFIQRHDDYGCASINNSAGVAGGHAAVLAECRL